MKLGVFVQFSLFQPVGDNERQGVAWYHVGWGGGGLFTTTTADSFGKSQQTQNVMRKFYVCICHANPVSSL